VIQADGGTRTASITGAWVALRDAVDRLLEQGALESDPIHSGIAAVSVGVYQGTPVLDLDYAEDCTAETDMNVVMNDSGRFIEVQGTAEGKAFSREEMDTMMELAADGIERIVAAQRAALGS